MAINLKRVTHNDTTYVAVTEIQLQRISLVLAHKVLQSNWKPTWVVALWRGGVTLGITVHRATGVETSWSDY